MKPDTTLDRIAQQLEADLRTVRQLLRRPIEADIARGRLTGPQLTVLQAVVAAPDGVTLKELSARVGLAHSTVSVLVDRLEDKAFVRRKAHPTDRRATLIVVTRPVRTYVERQRPKLRVQPLVKALARATPRERTAVVSGVRILRRILGP